MVYEHLNLSQRKKRKYMQIDIMLYITVGNHDVRYLYDWFHYLYYCISFFVFIIMICISFYINCILFKIFGP